MPIVAASRHKTRAPLGMGYPTRSGRRGLPRPRKKAPLDSDDDDAPDCSVEVTSMTFKFMQVKRFPRNLCRRPVRKQCNSVRNIQETSLHGLKYITESLRHSVERIFWLVTIVVAWAFAGYLIYKVCDKHFFKQFIESLAKGISKH